MNNIKQYFNFSNKLKHSIVMEKKVDERVIDVKEIRVKKVNWLPFFFTFLYPIFTQKYRTKGFAKDIWTLFGLYVLLCIFEGVVGEYLLGIPAILGNDILILIQSVLFGTMFTSWYRDRLIKNGYVIRQTNVTTSTLNEIVNNENIKPTSERNGTYCSSCGTWNSFSKDSKFCTNCGASINFTQAPMKEGKKGHWILYGFLGFLIVTLAASRFWMPLVTNWNQPYKTTSHTEKGLESNEEDSSEKSEDGVSTSSSESESSSYNESSSENIANDANEITNEFMKSTSFREGIASVAKNGNSAVKLQLLKDRKSDSYLFSVDNKNKYFIEISAGDNTSGKYEMNADTGQVYPLEGGPYNIPAYTLGENFVIPYYKATKYGTD